jgi:hypothetical protein
MTHIDAIKQAIDDMCCMRDMVAHPDNLQFIDKAITSLRQATEQEQQIKTLKRCLFQMQEAAKDLAERARSLTPPQRTWVGLTGEEIKEFDTWHDNREEEVGWCNPSEIVAYIEAKLKEKNT